MGERVEIPERIAICVRFRPRHCADALLSALSLSHSCPARSNLLSRAGAPAATSTVRQKTPGRERDEQLLTQSRNLLRSPAAYSPNAFFSALTRLRLTGIFSSHAVQREQQRAAGDRFDFLNHGKVHQVPAMHTEEPVAVQTLLELSQAHRGEVAVRVGLAGMRNRRAP